MQDLILTKLADIGDLKVIARTSTMQYGSHPQNLTLVGQQLGVAAILEGSVQKAGNQVLINVQLIDTKTDSHIWAQSYTRTLTNIFGVEGEVAEKVADALKAKLTSTEARQVATVPTQNAQAYDAYLRGQYYGTRANSSLRAADFTAAIKSYAKAVALDPRFALAWAQLADNLSWQIHFNSAFVDVPALAARAKAAADHALSLAPDMAEARLAQGWYQYSVQHDLTSALATFDAALTLQPHNSQTLFAIAVINKRRGHMQAAIAWYQKAVALDPRNVRSLTELSMAQGYAREYAAAASTARRALAIDPSSSTAMFFLAGAYRYAGDLDQAEAALNAAPAAVQDSGLFIYSREQLMLDRRNYAAARRLLAVMKPASFTSVGAIEIERGDVEWYADDRSLARQYYQRAESLIETALKQNPKTPELHGDLGWVYARLGRNKQALEQGELAIKLGSMSQDATVGMDALVRMTAIQAQVGQTEDAIAGLDRLLVLPVGQQISVPLLKLEPTWDPIRHDPAFQALLKKYANAQPASRASRAKQ
ncbi:MAG TPA: tetratricopeptide repeat protein [Rhodanobacteraceae bacterium]